MEIKIPKKKRNERLKRKKTETKTKPLSIEKTINSPVIRKISPEVPVVYGGKDLWKTNVLRRE